MSYTLRRTTSLRDIICAYTGHHEQLAMVPRRCVRPARWREASSSPGIVVVPCPALQKVAERPYAYAAVKLYFAACDNAATRSSTAVVTAAPYVTRYGCQQFEMSKLQERKHVGISVVMFAA